MCRDVPQWPAKICRNVPPYDTGNCRNLPLTSPHTAAGPEGTGQFSVRHLPLAQLEAATADAKVARKLRNRFNAIKQLSTPFNMSRSRAGKRR
jgi:hypothetical protein